MLIRDSLLTVTRVQLLQLSLNVYEGYLEYNLDKEIVEICLQYPCL